MKMEPSTIDLEKLREPGATQALRDLAAFLAISKNVPAAALALEDCAKLGLSIVVCDLDRDATEVAGKPVFRFQLQEMLARHLSAFLAG